MKIYEIIPIVIKEVEIDWLTVTLKYDNHGGGQKQCYTQGSSGRRCAIGLLRTLSINWT